MKTICDIPINYVDSLTLHRHILLLYEDLVHAKMIMFRFIKNGLRNGEECRYTTEEDTGSIVIEMLTYGIPLKYFQNRQLRVLQINMRSGSQDEILEKCRRELVMIQTNLKTPFRIVTRIFPNVDTVKGISAEDNIEKDVQCQFDNLGGSIMCPYDISKIEPSKRKLWLDNLRENHHAIIYVPKSGRGEVSTAN